MTVRWQSLEEHNCASVASTINDLLRGRLVTIVTVNATAKHEEVTLGVAQRQRTRVEAVLPTYGPAGVFIELQDAAGTNPLAIIYGSEASYCVNQDHGTVQLMSPLYGGRGETVILIFIDEEV